MEPAGALPAFDSRFPIIRMIQENVHELRDNWYWFVILGAALIVLGLVALSYSVIASVFTAMVAGYFLVFGGVFYVVGAFFTRSWGGFFLGLLAGVLHLAVGLIIVDRPVEAVIVYTLLMAVFFFVEGLFKIFAALAGQFRHWGWVFGNGVVAVLLGVLIWRQWPFDGLWIVGAFLGINLLVSGASYISLGLNVRRLPV
jgi:uncharacterized membrane protein HdeD (DUF308 family)